MTKFAATLLLAAGVVAQQQGINTTVLGQLAAQFQAAGLDQLAAAAASIANTTTGNRLLATITNGDANYTIFAPSDKAIAAGNQTLLGDPETLADIISYHVVPGFFANTSAFFTTPNNTILPTFLNGTNFAHLEGNGSQVLSASLNSGGDITVNNQNGTVTVSKVSTSGRFGILQIDQVLTPPKDLTSVIKAANLNAFWQAVQSANLTDKITSAQGITIFAPTDAAITKALAALGANSTNTTLIATIIQNHIINGTSIYTSELHSKNYTSAAGEALNFWVYNNTITVYSGSNNSIAANVTKRDILASSGVVHIIDAVLANGQRDDGAASSAYSSATSAAHGSATQTSSNTGGAVGGNPSGSPNKGNGAFSVAVGWSVLLGAMVMGVALGASSL